MRLYYILMEGTPRGSFGPLLFVVCIASDSLHMVSYGLARGEKSHSVSGIRQTLALGTWMI